jgi:hypothetical protein
MGERIYLLSLLRYVRYLSIYLHTRIYPMYHVVPQATHRSCMQLWMSICMIASKSHPRVMMPLTVVTLLLLTTVLFFHCCHSAFFNSLENRKLGGILLSIIVLAGCQLGHLTHENTVLTAVAGIVGFVIGAGLSAVRQRYLQYVYIDVLLRMPPFRVKLIRKYVLQYNSITYNDDSHI